MRFIGNRSLTGACPFGNKQLVQLCGVNFRVMPFDLQKAMSFSISACLGGFINALPS